MLVPGGALRPVRRPNYSSIPCPPAACVMRADTSFRPLREIAESISKTGQHEM